MKIKSLAIAAATLAVGAISSQAQAPVYSQNVVGYVNQIFPAGKYVLAANPLSTGNDVLTNVLHGVPGSTSLNYWTGSSFATYTYSTLGGGHWKNGAAVVDNTNLPPGVGFFIFAASTFTNTYSGTIVANTGGGTVTNRLTTSLTPVGAKVPYSDVVTNPASFNLLVSGSSTLEQWNATSQSFVTYTYNGISHTWKIGAAVTNPIIGVAEGFFIAPQTATNWVQTLQ